MALMDILASAQGGGLYAGVGAATGLGASETEKAMSAMCPAIARQLKAKSQQDTSTFHSLLDLLEDGAGGALIDDQAALTGAESISDGNAILDEIYGSRDSAIREMRKLAGHVPEVAIGKLAAISATAVLGALSRPRQAPMTLMGAQPLASSGGGGILGAIVSALIKGAVQGAARQLAPRRRRRATSYFGTRRKRSTTSRKRSSSRAPTLEDIFGEILGTQHK